MLSLHASSKSVINTSSFSWGKRIFNGSDFKSWSTCISDTPSPLGIRKSVVTHKSWSTCISIPPPSSGQTYYRCISNTPPPTPSLQTWGNIVFILILNPHSTLQTWDKLYPPAPFHPYKLGVSVIHQPPFHPTNKLRVIHQPPFHPTNLGSSTNLRSILQTWGKRHLATPVMPYQLGVSGFLMPWNHYVCMDCSLQKTAYITDERAHSSPLNVPNAQPVEQKQPNYMHHPISINAPTVSWLTQSQSHNVRLRGSRRRLCYTHWRPPLKPNSYYASSLR